MIARWPDAHNYALARLVLALVVAGAGDEAIAASESLLAASDATDNPHVASVALSAYGMARRDSDPVAASDVLRRGLRVSQDSGNRQSESNLAVHLSRLAVAHGDPMDALEYLTLAIRNHYDSGSFSHLREALGDEVYETFARAGETMTTSAMATYAYDQNDHARAENEHHLESDHIQDVTGPTPTA